MVFSLREVCIWNPMGLPMGGVREGKDLGEKYVDTGVSVITKKNMADFL